MAIHFECTTCGRCCHGLRLPLSLNEATLWLDRGGTVEILCDATPLHALPDPATAFRRERAFPARSGMLEIAVDVVLVASFEGACPNLLPDMRCAAYDYRPSTCRIYPAELNPARLIDPTAKRCPDEAWAPAKPILANHAGIIVDPFTAATIAETRHRFAMEAPAKEQIAGRLGIDTVALSNEGYAVWTPDSAALLGALHAAIAADLDDDWPDWSWKFITNRSVTRDLIVGAGADIAPDEERAGMTFIPFFNGDIGASRTPPARRTLPERASSAASRTAALQGCAHEV